MYKLLREIHLLLGLFVAPFALMYCASALQMGHPKLAWFRSARVPGSVLHRLRHMHHVAGVWADSGADNALGALVALVSAALIALALTGLLLWWRRTAERRAGLLLLAGSLAFSFALLAWVRSA